MLCSADKTPDCFIIQEHSDMSCTLWIQQGHYGKVSSSGLKACSRFMGKILTGAWRARILVFLSLVWPGWRGIILCLCIWKVKSNQKLVVHQVFCVFPRLLWRYMLWICTGIHVNCLHLVWNSIVHHYTMGRTKGNNRYHQSRSNTLNSNNKQRLAQLWLPELIIAIFKGSFSIYDSHYESIMTF